MIDEPVSAFGGEGYSGTPLELKLGIRPGVRGAVSDAPAGFLEWLDRVTEPEAFGRGLRRRELDLVLAFATSKSRLHERVLAARTRSVQAGAIWCCWPKRASKVPTDITEDRVRELAFANQLVDVKVCAISPVWSGLKLVIRRGDRH